ncbi:hypothetical protein O181_043767 [Austropuccinia psidii MF-1]|uniref:Uncharacterized protein n=1 Tax=Austropuccinia psidii MF-1 TaxID=1389203 RepID=A0A9Q3DL67_9BASI|nr:hypothetical protein [Austropuccinia psidii MF-1]
MNYLGGISGGHLLIDSSPSSLEALSALNHFSGESPAQPSKKCFQKLLHSKSLCSSPPCFSVSFALRARRRIIFATWSSHPTSISLVAVECVSSENSHSGTTYSCASSSCTDATFINCFRVIRTARGFQPDLNDPKSLLTLRTYGATQDSNYAYIYTRFTSGGLFGGPPDAICVAPIQYAHCTSCTLHQ